MRALATDRAGDEECKVFAARHFFACVRADSQNRVTFWRFRVQLRILPCGRSISAWALFAVFISLCLILARVLPLRGPFVFSDEYAYAAWVSGFYNGTQTPPPLAASIADWVYLRLYEVVYVGAGSFLVKARVLNAILSAMAAGVLVFSFQSLCPARKPLVAWSLAIAFSVGLLGTYAAYFIPEAPYFATVCVWVYCLSKYGRVQSLLAALSVGVVGGVATMTKAHGILMVPATLLVFVLAGIHGRIGWRRTAQNTVILILAWFACTTAIALVLGNGSGVDPLGNFYAGLAAHAAENVGDSRGLQITHLALEHLATLDLLLGAPLLLCGYIGFRAFFHQPTGNTSRSIQYAALALTCMWIGMLFVAAVFTVAVAGSGRFETLTRLHGRYYEHFALLAACVGILGSASVLKEMLWKARLVFTLLLLALLFASWWVSKAVPWQNPNDFAIAFGLFGAIDGRPWAIYLGAGSALAIFLWPRYATIAMACGLVIWLGFDAVVIEQMRWSTREPSVGRVAAMVADVEAGNSHSTVEIVADGATVPVYRAAFHLLAQNVAFALGVAGEECGNRGEHPDWVLVIGDRSDPCDYPEVIGVEGIAAFRKGQPAAAPGESKTNTKHFHAAMSLVSRPMISAGGRDVKVEIRVTNDGHSVFGSATRPDAVNLGAHAIDASGRIVNNDLARGHLPQIVPGASRDVSISFPTADVLGYRVELLPVQEDVAWFDEWGTKPLVIGPFETCSNPSLGSVCDPNGAPLQKGPGDQ